MRINKEWKDYKVIATGDGEKLERWGDVYLLRPDPQVIWPASQKLNSFEDLSGHYHRSNTGGGKWDMLKPMPEEWVIGWRNLKFVIKPMGLKHTGLFPEQAANWDYMINLIESAGRPISVLNLFAYTGGATVACASAGATVCHVDAAKNMVERCKQNIELSGIPSERVRYIIDDCKKFTEREIKRGKKYDAVIMDPPDYGRGPSGEVWKIEEQIFDLVELCVNVLSDKPLFFLINSYTLGLQPAVLYNILVKAMKGYEGKVQADEVCLPTEEDGLILPCGASGIWQAYN